MLEAESAERALDVARAPGRGPIDLLVSDVVMAGMTGGELAAELQAERPELLVVLVSGNVDATVVDVVADGHRRLPRKALQAERAASSVIAELRGRRDGAGVSTS